MRFSTSPLLSAVTLCAPSQSAVGAMALMDLDSRQILQLEGNLLFITEPLAEQLKGFPGMADKPVKAGETATEAFVARLAATRAPAAACDAAQSMTADRSGDVEKRIGREDDWERVANSL